MIITHASLEEIGTIETNKFGIRKGCLFFAGEGNTYNLAGECNYQLNVEVDENNIIETTRFWYEHDQTGFAELFETIRNEISDELDDETIAELLDDTIDAHDLDVDLNVEPGDASWIIQQYQGILAKFLGYDCCEAQDEQGAVFIKFMG